MWFHYVLAYDTAPRSKSSLDAWLTTATRGLCDEARQRVSAEVTRHVEETALGLQAEGLSADAALEEAVRLLGDPKLARRGFRRTELTQREYVFLTRIIAPVSVIIKPAVIMAMAAVVELMVVLACLGWVSSPSHGLDWEFLLYTQFAPVLVISGQATRIFWARGARRSVLAARMGSILALLMALPEWLRDRGDSVFSAFDFGFRVLLVIVVALALWDAIRVGPLWWKLRRVPPDRIRFG